MHPEVKAVARVAAKQGREVEAMRRKKETRFFTKYINGTKGVISLFLAILMVPFLTVAGALINAARLNSTIAIFDEALCNASNSALGTYDEFLRDRFGLMALSQDPDQYAGQLGVSAVTYTSEDFIQELFVYYMQKNLGSLSDAYDTAEVSAAGVYPLGDTKVLRASILQTSKITVPAKFAVEVSSLEEFMKMLTKPFDLLASIEDTLASGADVVADIDKLTDNQEKLEKQIEACNTARSNYETAYNSFATAVNNYNTLVGNIQSSQNWVNSAQKTFDEISATVADIDAKIEKKNEKIDDLKEDKLEDHSEEIAALEEEIEELEEEREEKAPDYDDAEKDLKNAKKALKNYQNQLSGKKDAVTTAKTDYRDKIVLLQEELVKTRDLAVAFQGAASDLVSHATDFIKNSVTTGLSAAQENCDKQREQLKEENAHYKEKLLDAQTSTDAKAAAYYQKCIDENNEALKTLEDNKRKYGNSDKVVSGSLETLNDVGGDLKNFASRDLTAEYKVIYDGLDTCRVNLEKVTVPSGTGKVSYTKANVYIKVTNPVEKAEISKLIEDIENQIVNNGGWAILQTIFGFFDALTNLTLTHNPNLNANINTSLYSANGGLPSKINRTEHSVANPYGEADAASALEYKKELNSYASSDVYEIAGEGESEAEKIEGYLNTIKANIKPFKLKNLKKLWDAAKGFVSSLAKLAANFVKQGVTDLLKGMRDRFYIVGYASYYTANRTTYTGKALTGTGFGLPQHGTDDGYVFNGAELEYIFKGSFSEKTNQKAAFTAIWVERMLFNISGVLSDALVQSVATALGSFTFGIGDVLTKLAFLAAEAYIDAVLLANSADIPIVKSCIFLSPAGIPKLMGKLLSLELSDDVTRKIYTESTKAASTINNKTNQIAQNKDANFTSKVDVTYPGYDEYKAQQKDIDDKREIADKFTMDYTKSLQIYMLLFGNNEKYVKRIADIIQMEASWKANHEDMIGYQFNLDKSYTYIRASGSFSSGVFMKIGEDSSYTSKNRVIYNGY